MFLMMRRGPTSKQQVSQFGGILAQRIEAHGNALPWQQQTKGRSD
jgi:hypothetical protein